MVVLITMMIISVYPTYGVAFASFFALERTRVAGWLAKTTGCPRIPYSRRSVGDSSPLWSDQRIDVNPPRVTRWVRRSWDTE